LFAIGIKQKTHLSSLQKYILIIDVFDFISIFCKRNYHSVIKESTGSKYTHFTITITHRWY